MVAGKHDRGVTAPRQDDANRLIPAWVDGRLQPVGKLDVHRRGLRHPAVSVFLTDGDRLLLQQRAKGKYHSPGLWANTCCTHPHWGEAPMATATRRLGEELGLHGLALTRRGQIEYRADVGGGMIEHELVDVFTAAVEAGALPLTPDPGEVMATRWIALKDLPGEIANTPARFTPWLRIYISEHAARIFGTQVA